MKVFYLVAAALVTLMGTAHSALTPVFYDVFLSEDALWFFGTGLALIFNGMLNLSNGFCPSHPLSVFCNIANVLLLLFVGMLIYIMPAPQALFSGALIVCEIIACFIWSHGQSSKPIDQGTGI